MQYSFSLTHVLDYILEMNDSPSGFLGKNELEDMCHVRDLVLEKLKTLI
jgi:hypothetical protein